MKDGGTVDRDQRRIDLTEAEAVEDAEQEAHGARDDVTNTRLRWWVEILVLLALYIVYSGIRNEFGSATVSPDTAFDNARRVIDIERESELGGAIHSKGVMILSAFLAARYARSLPLSLSASLVFEQSYGPVEGDSA